MPTILGLAGVSAPDTMDGRSIAPLLLSDRHEAPQPALELLEKESTDSSWRTELLIEYYGLGDVVRYEHLEDTQNNTFRTLRVIDPNGAVGERNLKLSEFTSWDNWDFLSAADEFELFDLDQDKWEMNNIYQTSSQALKDRLHKRLEELYRCRGQSCN